MQYATKSWSCIVGLGLLLALIALVAGFSALVACIVWALWNAAVVPTFDAPALSFWHAWGIWLLIALVGGAFRAVVRGGGER